MAVRGWVSEEGKVKGERNCRVRCGGWKDSEDGEGQNQTPLAEEKGGRLSSLARRPGCENGNSHTARTKEGQMAASSSPQSERHRGLAARRRLTSKHATRRSYH